MPREEKDLVAQIVVDQEAGPAFDSFVEDLAAGLDCRGIRLVPGAQGHIAQAGRRIGDVVSWEPGRTLLLRWHSPGWATAGTTDVEVRFKPSGKRTRISVHVVGWARAQAATIQEMSGWFAQQVAAPLLEATAPQALGDWVTDRRARRPSGAAARESYRDPVYHRPNFKLILHTLQLRPDDQLLEVGCGGGEFLREALASGCHAAAIDHSGGMTRLTCEVNRDAVRDGRLSVARADAEWLPYRTGRFSAAVSTGVFGFVRNPVAALTEIHRVMASGARFALFMGTREIAGTPAAPEPIASRVRFFEDEELERMAIQAGFHEVRVDRPDLEPYAREANLPEDALAAFRGSRGAQFLTALRA